MIDVLAVLIRLEGGGAERSAAITSDSLRRHSILVDRWACTPAREDEAQHPERALSHSSTGVRSLVASVRSLRGLILADRPDIVHLHCERPEFIGALALSLIRTTRRPRIVVTEHTRRPWVKAPLVGIAIRKLLKRMGATFVSCFDVSRVSGGDPRLLRHSTSVIRNPILTAGAPVLSLNNPKRVIVLGRLMPSKRVDLILESLSNLKRSLPGVVVGDGPERATLEQFANQNGLDLEFRGFQPHPWNELREGDVYVSASEYEGDPLAVSEALLRGVPVLLSNIDAHRELVDTVCLYEGASGLSDKLEFLLAEGASRFRLTDEEIEKLRAERSPEEIAVQWKRLYESVLKDFGH